MIKELRERVNEVMKKQEMAGELIESNQLKQAQSLMDECNQEIEQLSNDAEKVKSPE